MTWVLGALCLGAPMLMFAAYLLSLDEFDEVLDDSLRQTALLLADRDLQGTAFAGARSALPAASPAALASADTESKLVAIARTRDGSLLFSSDPSLDLRFEPRPGASVQAAHDTQWDVYTVVQEDRVVQLAQPTAVRRGGAAEAATQLLVPLVLLIAALGALLWVGVRRGMQPLAFASAALDQRNARSLTPLDVEGVPLELLPMVRTVNALLKRLDASFEAQRRFVADAAHELRSPVTALRLQAQILEGSDDPQARAQASAELSAGIERARRLIEQLLDLSHALADEDGDGPSVLRPVRLADLVRAAVTDHVGEAERRGLDLGADVRSSDSVHGSADQLAVLLSNLVENALRYTPRGGTVDVIAQRIDGALALSVVDDGPGIAASERERVFDRFYRSPDATASGETGSGLGLAIVRSVAERHWARVSLHPGRAGRGLEVRVTFPASVSTH